MGINREREGRKEREDTVPESGERLLVCMYYGRILEVWSRNRVMSLYVR